MSERKPTGVSWETWIERQIREGMEAGAFDHLEGRGRPLRSLDRRWDENSWIRDKLRREDAAPPPPPAIQIRIEVDAAMAGLADLASEDEVRALAAHLNERIRTVNRTVVVGPPTTLGPMPEAEVLEAWRRARAGRGEGADG